MDEYERSPLKNGFLITLHSLLAAVLLSLFAYTPQFHKYIFSLLALYIGIRFFKHFEKLSHRIIFIVLAIILYFLCAFVYAIFLTAKAHPELFPVN
ncbi:hypothetical protein ACFSTH_21045 [Paenibacillus yanchengensis]|uniref:Uncharacterized protein n=1 Tax=Paenibacillus yanchengensis TaxID=2035833 RepID=A0ABW4YMT2_9BACL